MDDFEAYLGTQNKSFPVPDEDFTTELAKYAGWFEAISGPAQDYGADRNAYAREFRRRMMAGSTDLIRFDRNTGELVAMITVANITGTSTQPANELRPQWEYFNGFMSAENANPEMQAASLGNGFQTSYRYAALLQQSSVPHFTPPSEAMSVRLIGVMHESNRTAVSRITQPSTSFDSRGMQ